MDELLVYMARHLVDNPEAVEVEMEEDDQGYILYLKVDPADMGKVIGKQGKIAKAMRKIIKAAGAKQKISCIVNIVE